MPGMLACHAMHACMDAACTKHAQELHMRTQRGATARARPAARAWRMRACALRSVHARFAACIGRPQPGPLPPCLSAAGGDPPAGILGPHLWPHLPQQGRPGALLAHDAPLHGTAVAVARRRQRPARGACVRACTHVCACAWVPGAWCWSTQARSLRGVPTPRHARARARAVASRRTLPWSLHAPRQPGRSHASKQSRPCGTTT